MNHPPEPIKDESSAASTVPGAAAAPDSPPQPAGPASPAEPKPKPSLWRRGRGLLPSLMVLPVTAGALGCLLGWGLATQSGSAWLLSQVPGLQVTQPEGSLLGDFSAQRLSYAIPGTEDRVEIDELRWRGLSLHWNRSPHLWGDLHIDSLQAKQVQLHLKPSAEPSTAPSSLSLPIGIQIARLQVGTLLLPDTSDKPFNDVQGSLSLSAQGGAEHQIQLDHLQWDLLQLSGSARVQTEGTLGLQAELNLQSKADVQEQLPAWQAQLQAKGPLLSLAVSAHLQAESQDLQAQAQVHPFAAWPLPQLKVNTQGLDLAALVSGLPHTRLSGQAEWQTQSAGTTASAALPSLVLKSQLSNSLAGRWNEQRLPARALNLDLSFAPGDPAALSIKQLELLLGSSQQPAGRVHASGQSSKDKGSALTIAISELNSQALDARAAALQVAGEIELRTAQPVNAWAQAGDSLPQLSIEAKLEGRLLSPDPRGRKQAPEPSAVTRALGSTPISLRTQAQISATALTLQSFKLRFDEATLDASGHLALQEAASLAKGWQATAQAQAQVPDLRRLWRGEEGSRWRQSAQPLIAQFDAKLQAGPRPSALRGQPAPLKAFAPSGTARLQVQPTVLAGVPLSADLHYSYLDPAQTPQLTALLNAGANNRLQVQGELKTSGELHSDATLQFAELSSLQPLLTAFRAPQTKTSGKAGPTPSSAPGRADLPGSLQGSLQGKVELIAAYEKTSAGRSAPSGPTAPRWVWHSKSELRARALQLTGLPEFAALRLAAADLQWDIDSAHQAPLELRAKLEQLSLDGINLPSASATVLGTWAQHRVELQALADGKMPAALIPPGEASDQRLRGPVTLSLNAGLSKPPTQAWLEGAEWQARELMFLAQPQGQAAAPAPAPPLLASVKPTAGKAAAPSSAWLKAQNLRMDLAWAPQLQLKQLQVAPGRMELLGAGLSWQELQWQAAEANPSVGPAPSSVGRFNLDLRLEPLAVAPLLARWQPEFGWSGDLVLAGHARVRSAPGLHVDIALERSSGDLIVSDDNGVQKLDLSELRFGLVGSPGLWHLTQALAGRNVGVLGGAVTARNENTQEIWPNKDSKLEGVLEARVANLSTWGAWVPAGWRTGGSVFASASFSGQLKAPEIKGRAGGTGLVLRNPLLGVDLQRGEFALSLDGGQAKLEQFKAYAGDGDLTARGEIQFGAKPRVDLHLQADKFGVLRRVDQRLAVNGRVDIALDADLVDVQGQLDVHEGLFDFSRGNAPELGDDVTVRRPETASAEADHKAAAAGKRRARVKVKVDIDLGKKLRVKGYGLDTLLAGNLQLTQAANGPALHGRISTESGTFDAYGQKLVIEKGNISFSGVMDNPRLDVLALRPSQEDQRVGVTITGTAQKPRVKLYSEPALDERSTLSWLLLGRAPSELGTQDNALLSSAALALLNGQGESKTSKLIKSVGLDELSFSDSGVEAQGTVVRLGKQLSKRWYVGYERGLNATTGSWQLIYRLAQRFTLRAQSGDDNALDLIWQWKWE